MPLDKYTKALSRDDLSNWIVHFIKPNNTEGKYYEPFEALVNIIDKGFLWASKHEAITKYQSEGAVCFYDVPYKLWKNLIKTNPNGRRGYGLVISKSVFWLLGGRPCIYTNKAFELNWPESERHLLIYTDLNRMPTPIDWTHEREWRLRGDMNIYDHPSVTDIWWWPSVETVKDAQLLYRKFGKKIQSVYVMELERVLKSEEIFF